MTERDDLDRELATWLHRGYLPPSPRNLAAVVARTRDMRQRPAWASLERWFPMAVITRPTAAPPLRAAWLALVTTMTIVLAAGALIIGGGLLRTQRSMALPPPTGPAGNGLIAFDAGGDIWTMKPDGTDRRQLTTTSVMESNPTWSPDGTRLAFFSFELPGQTATSSDDPSWYQGGAMSVGVMDADGGQRRELAVDGGWVPSYGVAPSWAPDSRRLAYAYVTPAGEPVVDTISTDEMRASRLTDGYSPSWSPDGSMIAFRGPDQEPGVLVIPSDGGEPLKLNRVIGGGFAFTAPRWSADQEYITFYAGPDGGHDVWVARSDGSEEWPVGFTPPEEYWPSFSPDGRRVAFGRDLTPCCDFNYVITNVDGTDPITLATDPLWAGYPGVWSPDGRFMLGMTGGSEGTIRVLVIDTTGESDPFDIPIVTDWVHLSWQRVATAANADDLAAPTG
jgi:Tol biopolymer transport system component